MSSYKELVIQRISVFRVYIFLIVFIVNNSLQANDDYFKLAYYCNEETSTIYINKSIVEKPKTEMHKKIIDWGSLATYSKIEKDRYGDPFRRGSKILTQECGNIKINFSFGYLNKDNQGELGGITFPVVEMKKNNQTVISKIALGECSIQNERFNRYGKCPDKWAESILLESQAYGKTKLTVEHIYD